MLDGLLDRQKKTVDTEEKTVLDRDPYVSDLELRLRNLQLERESILARHYQQEFEINRLRKEVGELKAMPSLVGQVQERVGNDLAVIRLWNGNEFLVSVPSEFADKIKDGTRVAMTQRSLAIIKTLPDSKDWEVHAFEVLEKPTVSFENVGGLEHEIRELEECVVLPLLHPERFEKLGISPPTGVLLHGLPGTGKTLLAKAVANKSHAAFISMTASELVKKYIGEGSRMVREVFLLAKEKKPAIIFIDELDAIGGHRGDWASGGDREVQRTLMQLLAEMDGFKERKGIAILGATNRLDMIDFALLRPGRFDRLITISLPHITAREAILQIHTQKMNLSSNVDLALLASETDGFSGADLRSVCMEAGLLALRENKTKILPSHFASAILKIKAKHDSANAEDENPDAPKMLA